MNLRKAVLIAAATQGLTQAELAEKAGTTGQNLYRMMRANSATLTTLLKLSEGLEMKLSEFIKLGE